MFDDINVKKLSFVKVICNSTRAFFKYFKQIFLISLCYVAAIALPVIAFTMVTGFIFKQGIYGYVNPILYLILYLILIPIIFIAIFYLASLQRLILEAVRKEEVHIGNIFKDVANRFWKLVAISIISTLFFIIPIFLLVFVSNIFSEIIILEILFAIIIFVLLLYISIVLSLAFTISVINDLGVFESIAHAFKVSRGNIFSIIGLTIIISLLTGLVTVPLEIIPEMIDLFPVYIIFALIGFILSALMGIYSYIAFSYKYLNIILVFENNENDEGYSNYENDFN